jgi:subtilisin family serine protease
MLLKSPFYRTNSAYRCVHPFRGWSLIFLAVCLFALPVWSQNSKHSQKPQRILLVPKPGIRGNQISALHKRGKRRLLKEFPHLGGIQVVEVPPGESVDEALKEYRASGLVRSAEPDHRLHASGTPNDPKFLDNTLWALRNQAQSGGTAGADIHAVAGWDVLHSAPQVIVAVIDSGVRYTHEDLAANMWKNPKEIPDNGIDDDGDGIIDDVYGMNAINDSGDPMDDLGHGTHVAGIIGALGDNGKGVTGVAWQVQLMALKFLDATGNGESSDAIQCIDYAREHGAKIINASWGGDENSDALLTAIQQTRDAGIIFVTAAGNDSTNSDFIDNYPANFPIDNIVVVCSTTRNDLFDSSYSNYSPTKVHLAAPGTGIYSTWFTHDRDYKFSTGTSMSTPYVSGVLALMLARFPAENSHQIIHRLLDATDPLPSLQGKCLTGGRVNLEKALGGDFKADFASDIRSGEFPLTVAFTNISSGTFIRQKWDFGDGSYSSEANPAHIFGVVGQFNASLTITDASGNISSKSQIVTVYPAYEIVEEPFNWIDPLTLSELSDLGLTDNGVSESFPLPFAFPFYASSYTNIFISANGLLGFSLVGLGIPINSDIPIQNDPTAIIAPYWDDLNPQLGGKISIGTPGADSSSPAVISWEDVPLNSGGSPLTFQAILYPKGELVFQYLEIHPEDPAAGGRSATIGIENETGTLAAKYSFHGSPNILTNQQTVRIRPKRIPFLQVTAPESITFNGHPGGPFLPESFSLWLTNTGSAPLQWSANSTNGLFIAQPESGALDPGTSTNLLVTLAPKAASLPIGRTEAELTLTNLSNALGSQKLTLALSVHGTLSLRAVPENPESVFHVQFAADPQTLYVIESSLDLSRWSPISTNGPAAGATIDFSERLDGDRRFYRARSLQ